MVYENIRQIAKNEQKNMQQCETSLLLDNTLFSFFSFDIFRTTDTAFTAEELDTIISEKKFNIKIHTNTTVEFLISYVDSIYVDGQKQERLLGQKGEIFFRLYLVYIDELCLNTLRSAVPNILENTTIVPQSFYTMLFIRNKMQRDNFALLYIMQDTVKVVAVRNGFYDGVFTINL